MRAEDGAAAVVLDFAGFVLFFCCVFLFFFSRFGNRLLPAGWLDGTRAARVGAAAETQWGRHGEPGLEDVKDGVWGVFWGALPGSC